MTDITSGSVYRIAPVTPNVGVVSVERDSTTFRLRAIGVPFKPHRVEAAATLVEQFQTVATVAAAGDGTIHFEEPLPAETAQRFYRVVYP